MFKEVLQIKPVLSSGDLNSMERNLNTRFMRVAKSFGKGLVKGFGLAAAGGAVAGLLDKLLNPLKETQAAIDRLLESSDTAATNAQQYGTTSGKLIALQSLGIAKGLQPEALDTLLTKYQIALAEARADKDKKTAVRSFANDTDIAESFLEFVQSLQKMDTASQLLVQQEIFGEKQIGKFADFLQADFNKLSMQVGGPGSTALTKANDRMADLNGLKDILAAQRFQDDILGKSKIINKDMVKSQDEQLRMDMAKENKNIKAYQDLANISISISGIQHAMGEITTAILSATNKFYGVSENLKKIAESPMLRGIVRFIKAE